MPGKEPGPADVVDVVGDDVVVVLVVLVVLVGLVVVDVGDRVVVVDGGSVLVGESVVVLLALVVVLVLLVEVLEVLEVLEVGAVVVEVGDGGPSLPARRKTTSA